MPTQANTDVFWRSKAHFEPRGRPHAAGLAHGHKNSRDDTRSDSHLDSVILEEVLRGVRVMEILVARLAAMRKLVIYAGLVVLSYVMSMSESQPYQQRVDARSIDVDRPLRCSRLESVRQALATIEYQHRPGRLPSDGSTAEGQVRGRPSAPTRSVEFARTFLPVLLRPGCIGVASSNGVVKYAVGNSIYIRITALFFLQNIIVADISSTQ